MQYQYYEQKPEGYQLKRPKGQLIFATIALLGLLALFLWCAQRDTEDNHYYMGVTVVLLILVLMYVARTKGKVVIIPDKEIVNVGSNNVKSYPFAEFLNFHIINQRTNGILVNRKVFAYFNVNGKNKSVHLGTLTRQKSVDQLISETESLIKRS